MSLAEIRPLGSSVLGTHLPSENSVDISYVTPEVLDFSQNRFLAFMLQFAEDGPLSCIATSRPRAFLLPISPER